MKHRHRRRGTCMRGKLLACKQAHILPSLLLHHLVSMPDVEETLLRPATQPLLLPMLCSVMNLEVLLLRAPLNPTNTFEPNTYRFTLTQALWSGTPLYYVMLLLWVKNIKQKNINFEASKTQESEQAAPGYNCFSTTTRHRIWKRNVVKIFASEQAQTGKGKKPKQPSGSREGYKDGK